MGKYIVAFLFLSSTLAFGWPSCSGNWIQVPAGTPSNSGTGGIGTVVTEGGQTFECEAPHKQKSSNSSAKSTSTSSASSGSTSSATGGDATASNNGNNSNDSITNLYAARIPVNTAYAPTALPTMNCWKGYSGGAQGSQLGISFGGGKVDENCERLEVARSYGIAGSWVAYCRVMITNKYSKEAGVTFDDCMKRVTEVQAPPAEPIQQLTPQVIVVPMPQENPIPSPEPNPIPNLHPRLKDQLLGICTFSGGIQCITGTYANNISRPTSVCREMILSAATILKDSPDSIIILKGNRNPSEDSETALARAHHVAKDLENAGVSSDRIKVEHGTRNDRTVEMILSYR